MEWNGIWGGSGIEKPTFDAIVSRLPPNPVGVEIGAGLISTTNFSKICKLYSIEDSEEWINIIPGVNYIHAPLVNGWYDINKIVPSLPERYDFIFIDGPCGGSRELILDYFDRFNWDCLIAIHDTYREKERKLAKEIARRLNRTVEFNVQGDPNNRTGCNGGLDHFAIIEHNISILAYDPYTGRPAL